MSKYTEQTSYRFRVLGEVLEISSGDSTSVRVEETRKNGQEDTHMSEYLHLASSDGVNFEWGYSDYVGYENTFEKYGSEELAQGILDFLNENGSPYGDGPAEVTRLPHEAAFHEKIEVLREIAMNECNEWSETLSALVDCERVAYLCSDSFGNALVKEIEDHYETACEQYVYVDGVLTAEDQM